MDKIKVLDKRIQELIAAGEVVERPASVVKELAENSIDAGATSVTVEIKNGGLSYIRISDNGCGMSPSDARTAFFRHATSKIRNERDLESIYTMGFRGEALCAVASVSKVRLLTKEADADDGYALYLEAGEIIEEGVCGCPDGTTITVNDLFYNTPARLQFMKSAVSEANHTVAIVEKLALSHPDISFRVIRDGKEVLFTAGDGQMISAIYSVYGKETALNSLPVDYSQGGLAVSGFVCKPLAARANRNMQVFFVNGRYIKNATMTAALERAYKNSMMTGRFPFCVLNLEIKANQVDVNVHPTKQEVKFSDENSIFSVVYYGVKSALEMENSAVSRVVTNEEEKTVDLPSPQVSEIADTIKKVQDDGGIKIADVVHEFKTVGSTESFAKTSLDVDDSGPRLSFSDFAPVTATGSFPGVTYRKPDIDFDDSLKATDTTEPRENTVDRTQPSDNEEDTEVIAEIEQATVFTPAAEPQILGELFDTYILAQLDDEFLMIDKHAAHERVIFNRLKQENGDIDTQMLLAPLEIKVSREDYGVLSANADQINGYGFSLEEFGEGCLITREIPTILNGEDVGALMEEIADALRSGGEVGELDVKDNILHSMACKAAVKAGSQMTHTEMKQFTARLLSMPEVKYCPHGRPVMVRLTKDEIEKLFRRKR